MQYYRCKCGKSELLTTDYPQPCMGCNECGTTFAQNTNEHKERVPHEWKLEFNRDTGKPDRRICKRCYEIEEINLS